MHVLGIVVCVAFIVGAIVVVTRAQMSWRTLVLASIGMAVGGVLGAVPGSAILIGAVVTAATGATSGTPWALLSAFVVGGMLMGIAGGGAAMVRLFTRTRNLFRASAFAMLGGALACLLADGALAFCDPSSSAIPILAPCMILSASLAGFALVGNRTRG